MSTPSTSTTRSAKPCARWADPAVSLRADAAPGRGCWCAGLGLFARACGLTQRETELLRHQATGTDTRGLARRMSLSEHTVQDHLKSVFAKTGVRSRRELLARFSGSFEATRTPQP